MSIPAMHACRHLGQVLGRAVRESECSDRCPVFMRWLVSCSRFIVMDTSCRWCGHLVWTFWLEVWTFLGVDILSTLRVFVS